MFPSPQDATFSARAPFSRLMRGLVGGCLLFAACASTPEQALVGKWQLANGTDTIEFAADGTVRSVEGGKVIHGTYRFLAAAQVQVEPGGVWGAEGPVVFQVWIPGDELILTLPGVGAKKYRRVQ